MEKQQTGIIFIPELLFFTFCNCSERGILLSGKAEQKTSKIPSLTTLCHGIHTPFSAKEYITSPI